MAVRLPAPAAAPTAAFGVYRKAQVFRCSCGLQMEVLE